MSRKNIRYWWVSISVILAIMACSIGPYTLSLDEDFGNGKQAEDTVETSEPGTEAIEEKNDETIEAVQETPTEESSMNSPAIEAGLEFVEEFGGKLLDHTILFAEIDRDNKELIIHRTVLIEFSDDDNGSIYTITIPEVFHQLPQQLPEEWWFIPSLMYTEDFIVYSDMDIDSLDDQIPIIRFNWKEGIEEILFSVEADLPAIPILLPESDYLLMYGVIFSIISGASYYNMESNERFELPAPEGWESGIIIDYLPETNSFVVNAEKNGHYQSSCWLYDINSGSYEFLFDGWAKEVSPNNRLIIYSTENIHSVARSELQYRLFDIKEREDNSLLGLPESIYDIGWAGSSDQIYFTTFGTPSELWLLNIKDQKSRMILDEIHFDFHWNNEGKYLVYKLESRGYQWAILDLENGFSDYIYIDHKDNPLEFLRWEE